MAYKQSGFPMHTGTSSHKSALDVKSPAKHIKLDKDNVSVKHKHTDKRPPKPKWGEKESPAKQAIGGDAGEAIDHWKKYKKTSQGVRKAISKKVPSFKTHVQAFKDAPMTGEVGKGKILKKSASNLAKVTKRGLGKVVTKVAKKGVGRLAGGPVGAVLGAAYGAYKSGQKHSGGKIDPNQKSIMTEGKKKGSIYDKKK